MGHYTPKSNFPEGSLLRKVIGYGYGYGFKFGAMTLRSNDPRTNGPSTSNILIFDSNTGCEIYNTITLYSLNKGGTFENCNPFSMDFLDLQ